MTLLTRPMTDADVPACVRLINFIIGLGGSTAHEEMFDDRSFAQEYFRDPAFANVVLENDRVAGFQAVFEVSPGLYSIGSFTDQEQPVKGAGRALTEKTIADCKAAGGTAILAKITEDNHGGLAFYSRMGFVDDHVRPADHQRPDGRVVDRIVKRLSLT